MRIVETDNYGGDYPDERFLNLPSMPPLHARKIAKAINEAVGVHCSRHWRAVPDDYKLLPGFEP